MQKRRGGFLALTVRGRVPNVKLKIKTGLGITGSVALHGKIPPYECLDTASHCCSVSSTHVPTLGLVINNSTSSLVAKISVVQKIQDLETPMKFWTITVTLTIAIQCLTKLWTFAVTVTVTKQSSLFTRYSSLYFTIKLNLVAKGSPVPKISVIIETVIFWFCEPPLLSWPWK